MSGWKTCLIGGLLAYASHPVAAQTLGAENCRATSAIVAQAIAGRSAGDTAAQVKARLTQGAGAVSAKIAPTVPFLVDWVYELDASAATPAMARQFEKQCMEF